MNPWTAVKMKTAVEKALVACKRTDIKVWTEGEDDGEGWMVHLADCGTTIMPATFEVTRPALRPSDRNRIVQGYSVNSYKYYAGYFDYRAGVGEPPSVEDVDWKNHENPCSAVSDAILRLLKDEIETSFPCYDEEDVGFDDLGDELNLFDDLGGELKEKETS